MTAERRRIAFMRKTFFLLFGASLRLQCFESIQAFRVAGNEAIRVCHGVVTLGLRQSRKIWTRTRQGGFATETSYNTRMTSSSTSLRASTLSFQNRSTLDPGSPARHRPANPHAARHPVRSPASAYGRRNRRCTAREPSADETSARAIDARANTAIAPAPPLSAAAAEHGRTSCLPASFKGPAGQPITPAPGAASAG